MKSYKELNEEKDQPKNLYYDQDSSNWGVESFASYGTKTHRDLVGVFNLKGQTKDFYLFALKPALDAKDVRGVVLKKGEKIYRYVSKATVAGGMMPLIKINAQKACAYFLTQESSSGDTEKVEFETKMEKLQFLRLVYTEDPDYSALEE